jgi:signal transduction histidine kinase
MRNQLAVAMANLEAFIDGKLPPTSERLESVMQTLHHLEKLIVDLNVLHPASSEKHAEHTLKLREINVCDLLAREFASLEAVALQKQVSLSVFRCPHPAAACQRFLGDPTRIGQIIKNVLLNAVRFAPLGGGVSVDCRRRADELQVTISDTGPGVPEAEAGHVFEPGFRGAGTGHAGSGLGLSVVKELVEAQGGSVHLDETAPSGARFIVRLPGELPLPDAHVR